METSPLTSVPKRREYERDPVGVMVKKILKAIPTDRLASIKEIADKSGCSWVTVDNWIGLIQIIQSESPIRVTPAGKEKHKMVQKVLGI